MLPQAVGSDAAAASAAAGALAAIAELHKGRWPAAASSPAHSGTYWGMAHAAASPAIHSRIPVDVQTVWHEPDALPGKATCDGTNKAAMSYHTSY